MSYDICLRKPANRERDDNRTWFDAFLEAFPMFVDEQIDLARAAEGVAEPAGMTSDEWVARGIGLSVSHEDNEQWVNVSFWDATATIKLPNFPSRGADRTIAETRPYREWLLARGFAVIDPESGEPVSTANEEAFLIAGYEARQQLVNHVATLAGGKTAGADIA